MVASNPREVKGSELAASLNVILRSPGEIRMTRRISGRPAENSMPVIPRGVCPERVRFFPRLSSAAGSEEARS